MLFLRFHNGPNFGKFWTYCFWTTHAHIGCLGWFSANCVKFVVLYSSFEKTFAKINFFYFFWALHSYREKKEAILGHTQNQSQPFLKEIKKQIISFERLFILSKYHILRLSLYIFRGKVIFTPAKTTIAASQL